MSQSSNRSLGDTRPNGAGSAGGARFVGDRVAAIRDQLNELFQAGYQAHRAEILETLKSGVEADVLLRFFLNTASVNGRVPAVTGTQSFELFRIDNYYMRLNIWNPKDDKLAAPDERLRRFYSIDVLHNHNFHIFMVGLFGPGYRSGFFRCDDYDDSLQVGDGIRLRQYDAFQLEKGVTRYIEIERDFHSQQYPESFSISANLIPCRPEDVTARQYVVDRREHIVTTVIAA